VLKLDHPLRASARPVAARHIVLDIEGTIGSIDFVKEVLFPHSRAALPAFLSGEWNQETADALGRLAKEIGVEPSHREALLAELLRLLDADIKHPTLKWIQGQIWLQGYASGDFQAHLYPDAVDFIRRRPRPLSIYSSGSIPAQRLYLQYSVAGDLRGSIDHYFDTTSGPKQQVRSYQVIAEALGLAPADLLFCSDAAAEVRAAQQAGWQVLQLRREPLPAIASEIAGIASFAELELAPN
jgi:enolase-phosphatase E1